MRSRSAVLLPAVVLAISSAAFAQGNDGYTRRSLSGLTGIHVVAELSLPQGTAESITDVELEVEAERILKKAGISIFDRDKTIQLPGRPKLYLRLYGVKSPNLPMHAVFLEASIAQRTLLERESSISIEADTWSVSALAMVESPDLSRAIKSAVVHAADQFVIAFREQNPRK